MDVKSGLFYLFSALMLFAAFRVITARNPVHAALFLVFAFFQAATVLNFAISPLYFKLIFIEV